MNKVGIVKKIIQEIDSVLCLFKLESYNDFSVEDMTGFNLYIKGSYGYIPYTLRFDFQFNQDELNIHYYISVLRLPIDGDKSDVYVLWGTLFPLMMKAMFNEENIVYFKKNPYVFGEIGGAFILFSKDVLKYSNTYKEGEIGALIYKFIQAQSLIDLSLIHISEPTRH